MNHFIHYSTVTADLARPRLETKGQYSRKQDTKNTERFVDEIREGVLIHTKTTAPDETPYRERSCVYKKEGCPIGIPCPDDLMFDDANHKGGFQDKSGKYCNCWINRKAEEVYIPKLEKALQNMQSN